MPVIFPKQGISDAGGKITGRKTACTGGDLLGGTVDKSWKRKYNSQRNIFRETDGFLAASQTHTA